MYLCYLEKEINIADLLQWGVVGSSKILMGLFSCNSVMWVMFSSDWLVLNYTTQE